MAKAVKELDRRMVRDAVGQDCRGARLDFGGFDIVWQFPAGENDGKHEKDEHPGYEGEREDRLRIPEHDAYADHADNDGHDFAKEPVGDPLERAHEAIDLLHQ